jgi:hypothetical protein
MSELGTRFKCYKCSTKFYDLSAPQPICPSCGENQNNDKTRQVPEHKKKVYRLVSKDIEIISHENDEMEKIGEVSDEVAYSQAAEDIDEITNENEDDLEFPE